jgi:pyruvate formate lyase activating enzyme
LIAALTPCSLIDFPGHVAAVVFTQGCNLRCRYCHNHELCELRSDAAGVTMEDTRDFFESRIGKLSGAVISGGEPTLHGDLPVLLRTIRDLGFATKLDTNGTHPEVVQRLMDDHLIDHVAVDVKTAPGTSSRWLIGSDSQPRRALETLSIAIRGGLSCEARTTVVEPHHTLDGLMELAGSLAAEQVPIWYLQPAEIGPAILDPTAALQRPSDRMLSLAAELAAPLGLETRIRGSLAGAASLS